MNRTATLQYMSNISEILERKESKFLEGLFKRLLQIINYGKMLVNKVDRYDINLIIKHLEYQYNAEGFTSNKSNKRIYVAPRQILATFLMDNTKTSLKIIGEVFCAGRGHDNVIYSHKAIDNLVETNPKFRAMFKTLLKKFNLKYYKYKLGYRMHIN